MSKYWRMLHRMFFKGILWAQVKIPFMMVIFFPPHLMATNSYLLNFCLVVVQCQMWLKLPSNYLPVELTYMRRTIQTNKENDWFLPVNLSGVISCIKVAYIVYIYFLWNLRFFAHGYMVSDVAICEQMFRSVWPRDGTLTVTTTLSQNGPGSNGNERVTPLYSFSFF